MNKESIILKYKGLIVARDNLSRPIDINRLADEDLLKHFIYNMYGPRDESLTSDGLKFLDEFYGLDHVAQLVINEKMTGTDYTFESAEEVIQWLKKFANFK